MSTDTPGPPLPLNMHEWIQLISTGERWKRIEDKLDALGKLGQQMVTLERDAGQLMKTHQEHDVRITTLENTAIAAAATAAANASSLRLLRWIATALIFPVLMLSLQQLFEFVKANGPPTASYYVRQGPPAYQQEYREPPAYQQEYREPPAYQQEYREPPAPIRGYLPKP